MRIGFTGAQGTGKTTLLRAVEENDMGYAVVPSTAREALKAGYKLNREADPLSQLVTTVSRVALEDNLYRLHGKTIGDRTPLDSLAYTAYQMALVWPSQMHVPGYYWNISEQLVVEHMHKYDHIFYFPPYFAPKRDGVRDGDVQYQNSIDEIIKRFLNMHDIRYHTIPDTNTQQRLSFLTKAVN